MRLARKSCGCGLRWPFADFFTPDKDNLLVTTRHR